MPGRLRARQQIPHADSSEKIARMARVRFQLAPQTIDDDREEVTLSYVLLAPGRLQQNLHALASEQDGNSLTALQDGVS